MESEGEIRTVLKEDGRIKRKEVSANEGNEDEGNV